MGHEDKVSLVGALSSHGALHAPKFTAKAVANTVWALAKIGVLDAQRFIDALSHRAKETAHAFEPPDVPKTLWSLATIGVKSPERKLIEVLGNRAVPYAKNFSSREVSDTLWALAAMGTMHLPLVQVGLWVGFFLRVLLFSFCPGLLCAVFKCESCAPATRCPV